jgi:hypothetical protein
MVTVIDDSFYQKGVWYMSRRLGILLILISQIVSTNNAGETPELAFDVPQLITDATVDIESPAIAIDQVGNIIVAWTQKSLIDSTHAIFAARYNYVQGTWTSPKRISSYNTINHKPAIAMDPAGNAIVVWIANSTVLNYNAYAANFYIDGGWQNGWSNEIILSSGSILTSIHIAMDMNGNGMAAWSNLGSGIQVSFYNSTTRSWLTPTVISTSSATTSNLAFDELNNAIVVWRQNSNLYATRYTPGQIWPLGWSANVLIDNNSFISADLSIDTAKTALGDAAGDAMVVYQGADRLSIVASFYDNTTSSWQTPETLASAATVYYPPLVKMDKDGNAVATWLQEDLSSNVHSTHFDFESKSWTLPDVIISPTAQDAEAPDLAMDKFGNAIATWYRIKYNPDTTVELIIQANQNKADRSWFPAHDISLLDNTANFYSSIAINNNHMAAAAWGFPFTSLYVSRALEIPELTAQWITLGTASAVYMTASGDGTFYLDIISNGIVYTLIHYPNTAATAWNKTQVSPDSLYAYEIAGSTDTNGNHAVAWTATTRTRATTRTAYLTTTRTTRTTTTRTAASSQASIFDTSTTVIISEEGQDAISPHVTLQQPKTTTTRALNLDCHFTFYDQTTTKLNVGTTTTTTRQNLTRATSTLQTVSPEGAFATNSYVPQSATAIATAWLITDTQNNITRVQANYQSSLDDFTPQGYRYISPANVDIISTITPLVYVDSQGSCLFSWAARIAGESEIQVTSFKMTDINEEWLTFTPSVLTLETIPSGSSITNFSMTGDSYNALLTRAVLNDTASYYYNHKTITWSLVSPTTRGSSLLDSLNNLEPQEQLIKAAATTTRLATTAIGYVGSRGARTTTTTRTTTRTPNTKATTTTATDLQCCQFDGFTEETTTCSARDVSGEITNISGATSWTGGRQATTTTRTRTTTTTTRTLLGLTDTSDEDILEVFLTQPSLPQPLSPTHVRARQEIHRFPRFADVINIITWQQAAPQAQIPVATSYKIFLAPDLSTPVATIAASSTLCYAAHQKNPKSSYTYYIYAVDDQGTYSDPVKVTLPQ